MNIWIVREKNTKKAVTYCCTRKEARWYKQSFAHPEKYEIIKFVEQKPTKQFKGYRYFEVLTVNYRTILYRAKNGIIEYSVNKGNSWTVSDKYKTVKQILADKDARELVDSITI